MQIRTKWLFPGSSSSIVSSRLVSSFPCLRASWNHPQDSAHLQYYHLKDMCSLKLCPPSRLFLFSHMSSRISCIDFCNRMLQIEMWPTVIHTAPTMVTDSDLQMSVGREVFGWLQYRLTSCLESTPRSDFWARLPFLDNANLATPLCHETWQYWLKYHSHHRSWRKFALCAFLKALAAIWRKIEHGWKIRVFHENSPIFMPNTCLLLWNGLMNSKLVFCTFTGMVTAICWCIINSNWGHTAAKHFGEPHFGDFALYYRYITQPKLHIL